MLTHSTDTVYGLADLDSWCFPGTALAVVGHPVKHSVSPAMHNAALAVLAKNDAAFSNWRYFRFDIEPSDLEKALSLFNAKNFFGLNLTVPHKVLAYSKVAQVDAAAQPVGAVNTLLRRADGYIGYNTDGIGLSAALTESFGLRLHDANVVLFGAGGAARGAAVECLQGHCRSLWIGNRTASNLASLIAALEPLKGGALLESFDPFSSLNVLPTGAIVINATSAGLRPGDPSPVDLSKLAAPAAAYDMIYNPAETAFLRQAAELRIPCANGLSMLVHQGAASLQRWTGKSVDAAVMRKAAEAALH